MKFFATPNINFARLNRPILLVALSVSLICVGLVIAFGLTYGIDFLGGTSIELRFEKNLEIADVRAALSQVGFGNAEIKTLGTPTEILIRVQDIEPGTEISDAIQAEITKAFPDNPYSVQMVEKVGPKIGAELRTDALWAILVSSLTIMIYIWWRFKSLISGVGALAALAFDVLITLAVFCVFKLEISLSVIAAFLTIVGYSINDKIVVYDRIRENLKILRRETFENLVNISINQTLSRTVLTGGTTLMVLVVLYLFGGEVIHNFSLALLLGIIIGTYSSMFVATPIIVEWHNRRQLNRSRVVAKVPAN